MCKDYKSGCLGALGSLADGIGKDLVPLGYGEFPRFVASPAGENGKSQMRG